MRSAERIVSEPMRSLPHMISTYSPLARLLSFTVSLSMFVTGSIFPFGGLFAFGGGSVQQTESGYRKKGPPVAGLPSINQIRAPKPEVKMQEKFKTLPRKKTDKCNLNNIWCLQRKGKKQAGLFTPEDSDKPADKLVGSKGNRGRIQRAIHQRNVPPAPSSLDIAASKVNSGLLIKNVARRHPAVSGSAATPIVKAGAKIAPVSMAMTPPPYPATVYQAKLDRRNRVGEPGVDLLSGNFQWSIPLMEFPGRASLDLGVSLSHNSRRWIRSGNHLNFDLDYDIAPGFDIGLPKLDGPYFERGPTIRDFILILGSGKRIELRDVGSRTFRSFDSSFLEMREQFTGGPMTLRTPDGTALKFVRVHPQLSYWRCVEIKDRYGNFITIDYNANSPTSIDTITDSLGRTISFIYDENYFLTEIRQTRGTETFRWALFDYGEKVIQTNFASGLTSDFNGYPTPILESVTLADGSKYAFEYTSYIQVKTMRRQVTDGSQTWERAWTSFNLPDPSAGATPQMSDCPVFTQRTNWANWWGQATTNYSPGPNNNHVWGSMTMPDGTLHREWFHDDNGGAEPWKLGLRYQTDTWASGNNPPTPPSPTGGNPNKKTSAVWEQANTTGFGDPRPQSVNIYDDAGNRKQSVFTYTSFNLPTRIDEYGGTTAQQSLLRYTESTYELSTSYTGATRRIIGLPKTMSIYSGGGVLSSKAEYVYDDYSSVPLETLPDTPTQFVSPGTNILGLATQTRRYDVTSSSYLETKSKYYPTGQVAKVIEPTVTETVAGQPFIRTNQTTISYSDSFAAPGAPSPTHAYPTSVTDAENHTSTTQYNYHTGQVTKTTDPKGASATILYDTADRIQRVTNDVNQAYTRYAYAPDQFYVNKWTTIENGAGEFLSYTTFDGHDRPFLTLKEHPGITGTYSVVHSTYDNMGRLHTRSNPTETDSNWGATGDDATGYVFSGQKYDWKGRPTVTYFQGYNPDPNLPPSANEPYKEREIVYGGCGCSGGETMTIIEAGQMTDTGHQRRKRKVIHDGLGRVKIEQVFEWEAATNPYSTKTTTYDASDRVTNIEDRAESSGATQNTVMIYDGYGRLWQRRLPEFQDGAYQTYEYNDDDTLKRTTDARGAVGNFGYYPRKQIRIADYESPPGDPNMTDAPTVNFKYDGAGNMTEMDDGPGKVKYVFDMLSRLTEERRFFDALDNPDQLVAPDPEEGGRRPFILKYEYNLAGQIKKFTDPRNDFIQYSYNSAGSLTSVTGSSFAGVTNYVTGIQYRAWGSPKQASYGSGHTATSKYSNRMQIQQYNLPGLMGATYAHNPDGQLRTMMAATDANPTSYDRRMDRSFLYDHVGRTIRTRASNEAGLGGHASFLFRQDYSYDAFSNMTVRGGMYWPNGDSTMGSSFNATYTNNKATTVTDASVSQTWTYDEMGHLEKVTRPNPSDPGQTITLQDNVIDAVGRIVETGTVLDGAGQVVKKVFEYYLRSRVFGGQIATTLTTGGNKTRTNVYVGGHYLAQQSMAVPQILPEMVRWYFRDPLNTMSRQVDSSASPFPIQAIDPLGVAVNTTDGVDLNRHYTCLFNPANPLCSDYPPPSFYTPHNASGGSASGGSWGYSVKVDGALSIYSVADMMGILQRQGINASVWISPALIGTPLTQGLSGSFIRRTTTGWVETPGHTTSKGKYESNWEEVHYDTWDFVPGGEPDPQTQAQNIGTRRVNNFYNIGDKCRGVINAALKGKNIDNIVANAAWNVVDETHADWNKKLSELGFTSADFSESAKLDLTLGQYFNAPIIDRLTRDERYPLGITNPRRNGGKGEVWISPRNASQRGISSEYTYFHESLHIPFGNHDQIVKALKIPEYNLVPGGRIKITDPAARIDRWVLQENCGTDRSKRIQ